MREEPPLLEDDPPFLEEEEEEDHTALVDEPPPPFEIDPEKKTPVLPRTEKRLVCDQEVCSAEIGKEQT